MPPKEDIRRTWKLFHEGHVRQADILAAEVIKADKGSIPYLPIVEILTAKAQVLGLTDRRREAAPYLLKSLNWAPENPYPQELMLAMLRVECAARNGHGGGAAREGERAGRLVLGLGTGRCGSTSFTQLLMAQKEGCFSHEHPPDLPWNRPPPALRFHFQRFALLSRLYDIVGDVAHWWLPHMQSVAAFFPDFRAAVLKRGREETVESFFAVKEGGQKGGVNHWMDHDGSHWDRVPFDRCYPSYPAKDMREAIGRYWDDYYAACERLAERYPGQVRIFDMTALKSDAGQEEILRFCGFAEPVLPGEFHANVGNFEEGEGLWGNPFAAPQKRRQAAR